MLGLARHSQLAGWGTLPPPSVAMTATSSLKYAVTQQPAYSLSNGMATTSNNQIDLTGYSSLSGYAHGKYTMAFSFRPNYSNTSYSSGQYLGNIGRFQVLDYSNIGTLPDGWFIYCVANTGYNSPVNFNLGYGTPGWNLSADLPGSYLDWNGTWFYIVVSVSTTQSDFADWNAPSFSTGNLFVRLTMYDQETGELYLKQDRKATDANMPVVTDLANPLITGNPYSTTTDLFDIRIFNAGSVGIDEHIINNFWCSYGTMFDPITLDQAGVAWRTTRPSKQIGSAVAWTNIQMTDTIVEGNAPNRNYWVKMSGDDLYSGTGNKAMGRSESVGWRETDAFNPSDVWSNAQNTIIPTDRNI